MGKTIVLGQTGISVAPYFLPPSDAQFDSGQLEAIRQIETTPRNFFVTGGAGCGKTTTIRALCGDDPVVLTVDTFLKHKPWRDYGEQVAMQKVLAPKTLMNADRIILEEIGQWTGANLELLNIAMMRSMRSPLPFGGIQMVAVGDLGQLPPIDGDTVDNHPIWQTFNPVVISLKTLYRQDDEDFLLFLGDLREAITTRQPLKPWAAAFLDYNLSVDSGHRSRPESGDFLGVTMTRAESARQNKIHIDDDEECFVDGDLVLPLGCPVQVTWNVWKDHRLELINGQFGTLVDTKPPTVDVDGKEHVIEHLLVKENGKGKPKKVFPLECAYYTRLHRLQGQTVEKRLHIIFDSIASFDLRAIYVGISRCRDWRRLSVENMNSHLFAQLVSL
jgi:ATP-dependent DNA helicase PIF1